MGHQFTNEAGSPDAPLDMRRHVHHSYIWLGALRTTFFVVVAAFVSVSSSLIGVISRGLTTGRFSSEILIVVGIGLLALLVIVALLFLFYWLSYKHLCYVLGPDEFNLYSGILNKKHVHVPYNKVQSVDQKATLLQRIAGVRTVHIDTAGGSSNKAVTVPYLTKHDAEWLAHELFARKSAMTAQGHAPSSQGVLDNLEAVQGNVLDIGQEAWDEFGGVFAGESFDAGTVSYEYGLSNGELFLAGLSGKTSFAALLAGFFVIALKLLSVFFDVAPGQSQHVMETAFNNIGEHAFQAGMLAVTGFVVAVVVVIWTLSAIWACIGYGGFRARRRQRRIEVQYGLLQHTIQGVDVDRVQAVIVTQSFIRRIFGYCSITLAKVDAQADGDDSKKASSSHGVVIHPFARFSRVPEILEGILPEFDDIPIVDKSVAPVALRRAVVRRCIVQGAGFWLAVCTALFQIVCSMTIGADEYVLLSLGQHRLLEAHAIVNAVCMTFHILAVMLTILSAIGAVLWARSSGFGFNRRFMQIKNGGFTIETTSFPRRKIQYGYTKTNPLQRHAQTATIRVRTAAGVGGTTVSLIDVREQDAASWLAWLVPHQGSGRV